MALGLANMLYSSHRLDVADVLVPVPEPMLVLLAVRVPVFHFFRRKLFGSRKFI